MKALDLAIEHAGEIEEYQDLKKQAIEIKKQFEEGLFDT